MESSFKIEEVAKQSGLSKRTIRYYEEIGVLPSPKRSKGGTRQYTHEHIEFLKKITLSKEVLGFSLQELQHFISLTETLESQKEDYKKVTEPKEQTAKLHEIIKVLDDQLSLLEEKSLKIRSVQAELLSLKERAGARIAKLNDELIK